MDVEQRKQTIQQLRDYFANVQLEQLVAEHGTPLLLLDVQRFAAQYRLLQSVMPGVQFYYALKALSHPAVIQAIVQQDGYIDVATRAETDLALHGGVPSAHLMYTHPVKKPAEIDYAYSRGIRTFVIDNDAELKKFIGRPDDIRLLVRLSYQNSEAKSDLSYKFGANPDAAAALVLQAEDSGLHVAGFSLHVGSQSHNPQVYHAAITRTTALMEDLERQLGRPFSVLNIGGGFPVAYRTAVPSIQEIAAVIYPLLKPLLKRYTIYAEPGRFVAGPAMHAVTGVVGVAERQGQPWYYLDDGVYGSYGNVIWEDVRPAIIAAAELARDLPPQDLTPSVLAGPTCDSVDIIDTAYPLPALKPGDLLLAPNMGAYTAATATQFNGIPPAQIILVSPGAAPGKAAE